MHVVKHFLTVCRHRRAVRKLCFKCGLFRQGLAHDLSKFSRAEFWSGAKYYQGNRSPQAKEREVSGYSAAWLHHKGRNKHHFEYWTDFADGRRVFVEMPPEYFAEMLCDRIAASKIYLKDKYTDSSPLEYFNAKTDKEGMNPKSCEMLEYFLTMLKEKGEKQTLKDLKKFVKENK
jgi:hypothetical protein